MLRDVGFHQIHDNRRRTVDRDGSPVYRHTFGQILTTAREAVMMRSTFPASRRYEPLMNLRIINNSTQDVDVAINGQNYDLIPAGVITSYRDTPVWYFVITNNDSGTVTAGTVRAQIWTEPLGADRAVRRGL